MKKILHKFCSWLVLLAATIAWSAPTMAQNVIWNFYSDASTYGNGGTKDGVSVFAMWWTGSSANLYSGDTTGTGYGWVSVTSRDETIVRLVFHGDSGMETLVCSTGEFKTLTSTQAEWQGKAHEVIVSSNSDVYTTSIDVYYDETCDATDYTLRLVDAPEGATVTIDGTTHADGDTWTVNKRLRLTDLTVTDPEGYYTESSYDASTHTFTVVYKHWYYYDVVIDIPTYVPNASVYDGKRYYQTGQQIVAKTALTPDDLSVYDLDGFDEAVTITPGADAYHGTVTAIYTLAAEKSYEIIFPDGTPAGTNVAVLGTVFTRTGTYLSRYDLRYYDFSVNVPDGYYSDETYVCYNPEARTFTVSVHEYHRYLVEVVGTNAYGAGVVYDGTTYTAGQTINAKDALTASNLKAAKVSGLEGTVSIAGSTVTATYTQPEYILIDTSEYPMGGYWTLEGSDVQVQGNGVPLNLWYYAWGSNWTATVSSSTFPIEKIEFIERDGDVMYCDVSCGTFANNVWTSNDGEYYTVTFDPNGGGYYNDGDYYISAIRVWFTGHGEPAPKEPFDYLKVSPAAGELSALSRYITIYAGDTDWMTMTEEGETFVTYISTLSGDDIPSGVTLTDADGQVYDIESFILGGQQVNITLAESITTPGVYTLHIPAALGETTSRKVNGEWTITWVVATATGVDALTLPQSAAVYNLAGQRTPAPATPGVYVKNGQKTIVK